MSAASSHLNDGPRRTGSIIYEKAQFWFETSAYRDSANPLQGPFTSVEAAYDFAIKRRHSIEAQAQVGWQPPADYTDAADLPRKWGSWTLLLRSPWTYGRDTKGIIYRYMGAWWFEPYAVYDHANPISGPFLTFEEAAKG